MTRITSTREAARRIGVSETALRKAEATGRIAREPDGSWHLDAVRQAFAHKQGFGRRPSDPPPWATSTRQTADPGADIVGSAREIHAELEAARLTLEKAARRIAALYPEILRLERARDAAIAAQEREAP